MLDKMSMRARLTAMVVLALMGFLFVGAVSLYAQRRDTLESRKEKIQNIVQTGLGIVKHYENLATQGKLPQAEAQRQAKEVLAAMRFGTDDYMTILDKDLVFLMHPIKPEWEGKGYSFFQNTNCEYFPCHATKHPEDFNCLFCYCPLYALGRGCGIGGGS